MRKGIEERCVQVGRYLFENSSTVRATAKEFQMSKTTVHTERTELQKNKIPEFIELPQVFRHSMPARVTLAVRM